MPAANKPDPVCPIARPADNGGTKTLVIYADGLPAGPLGCIGVTVAWGSAGQSAFAIVQGLKKGSGAVAL